MANAEIEKTLKKITDTQLVIVRLMETHERKWDKRFDSLQDLARNHEGRLGNVEQGAERLLRAIEKLWTVAAAHDQRTENLRRLAEAHEQRLDDGDDRTTSLHDEVRTMVASMDRLIKMLENFAKGRKRENGHRR
jgi:chromosome segregation ATPase